MKRYLKIKFKNPAHADSAISTARVIVAHYKVGLDKEENKRAFNKYFFSAFNGNMNKFDVYVSYAFACFVDASDALSGKVASGRKYDLEIEFVDKMEVEATTVFVDTWEGSLLI